MRELYEVRSTLISDPEYKELVRELARNKKHLEALEKITNKDAKKDTNLIKTIKDAGNFGGKYYLDNDQDDIITRMRIREKKILPKELFHKLNGCRMELHDDGFIGGI